MEVFFGNLPQRMSAYELRQLVNQAMMPKGFVETAKSIFSFNLRLKRLEFNVISEVKAREVVRYGKASIEPDLAAEHLISRLNDRHWKGKRLKVREFRNRTYNNDRRAVNWRDINWAFKERRSNERRIAAIENRVE